MSAPPQAGPLPPPHDKRRYVREMFEGIAPSYDLLNHLLSLNIDRGWRKAAVAALDWERAPHGRFLDACAGTQDLAAMLAGRPRFGGRVIAADFALGMLKLGRDKAPAGRVSPVVADAVELPVAVGTFDGAMVAFGVRNLTDIAAGFVEFHRVLKPGAKLVVLDFTTPRLPLLRAGYLFYFRRVLPLVGRLVSGHPTAYNYLPSSVVEFPPPESLRGMMEAAGYHDCGYRLLTGGIAALHWGVK